jgi:hypothetical protein
MIVGISGKAQSGKDTVSKMIVYTIWYYNYSQRLQPFSLEHYNNTYEKFGDVIDFTCWYKTSFANKLKQCLSNILNVSISKFEDNEFKKSEVEWLGITVRELLQKFGTAIRNEVGDDFWVKACLNNLEKDGNYLITDVRFKSEAKGIKDLEGIIVRVNREGAGAGNHISEIDLDDYSFDYVINNDGNMEDLLLKVKEFCIAYNLILC